MSGDKNFQDFQNEDDMDVLYDLGLSIDQALEIGLLDSTCDDIPGLRYLHEQREADIQNFIPDEQDDY